MPWKPISVEMKLSGDSSEQWVNLRVGCTRVASASTGSKHKWHSNVTWKSSSRLVWMQLKTWFSYLSNIMNVHPHTHLYFFAFPFNVCLHSVSPTAQTHQWGMRQSSTGTFIELTNRVQQGWFSLSSSTRSCLCSPSPSSPFTCSGETNRKMMADEQTNTLWVSLCCLKLLLFILIPGNRLHTWIYSVESSQPFLPPPADYTKLQWGQGHSQSLLWITNSSKNASQ